MKNFRLGYSLFVLMLMSLFSKNVNLYANITKRQEISMGVDTSHGVLTKAGQLMRLSAEHVQENILSGNYLEIVLGAIAICVFILFTIELMDNKEN